MRDAKRFIRLCWHADPVMFLVDVTGVLMLAVLLVSMVVGYK